MKKEVTVLIPRKRMIAIDFNNMLFGSYYGAPLINSHGMNVNAIKGFFFKLQSLKQTFNPDYIVITQDLSRTKTFRRKLYRPYKAQRKPMDEDILHQMQATENLLGLIGYPFLSNELYEADDILGMLSRYGSEHDMDTFIISTDRDLYQLIDDHTVIFNFRTRDIIDRSLLFEQYQLTPEQWIELKMLQGDRSDNIPGVPGIGEVGALKLMQTYGSIDSIYAHLGYLKPGIRNALINGKDSLPLSRQLVTIVTDYHQIQLQETHLNMGTCYENALYETIGALEIPSLFNVMRYCLLLPKEQEVQAS